MMSIFRPHLALLFRLLAVLVSTCLVTSCAGRETPVLRTGSERLRQVAEAYAPVILQETDSRCHRCDYITKFNFDGNYRGSDNWENLADYDSVPAYVYYSVTETSTHFYIGYFFFHPRDWGVERGPIQVPISNHENDLEGVMLLVEKTFLGLPGSLLAVETQGHSHFYQFASCPLSGGFEEGAAVLGGLESLDGCVVTVENGELPACGTAGDGCLPQALAQSEVPAGGTHPVLVIESNGHGVSACNADGTARPLGVSCRTPSTGSGIIYLPGAEADLPGQDPGSYRETAAYQLIAMEAGSLSPGDPSEDQGFWYLRGDFGRNRTFASWGRLNGDRGTAVDMVCGPGLAACQVNAALAPWVWDDPDDGPVYTGDWFCDPAYSFGSHLDGPFEDRFDMSYLQPFYYSHVLQIDSVRVDRTGCDSGGSDCDVYLRVRAGTAQVASKSNWLVDNFPSGEWVEWSHGAGGSSSTLFGSLLSRRNQRYICREGGLDTPFWIEALDADTANPDDRIGQMARLETSAAPIGFSEADLGEALVRYRIDTVQVAPQSSPWLRFFRDLAGRFR